MAKFLTAILRDETSGDVIGVLPIPAKVFSTGKDGYHGQGKIDLDGVRYQAQVQLVRIGSGTSGDGDASGDMEAR